MIDEVRLSPLRGVALGVVAIGLLSAGAAAVAGIVLADIFTPHAPGADRSLLPADALRSVQWTDWHCWSSAGLVLSTAVSLVLVLLLT